MPPTTEILVHVSAPSRASDDARYRNEARGYLHFEASVRHAVHVNEHNISGPRIVQDGGDSLGEVTGTPTTPAPSAPSPSPDSSHKSQRTVLASALAATSGPWRTPEVSRAAFKHAPISETPAINPWNRLQGRSPYIDVKCTPANTRPRTAPTKQTCIQETPHPRRAQSDSWETPPSVVPDSQPSIPHNKRLLPSSSPSPTRRSSSPSPKRRRTSSVQITSPIQASSNPLPLEPKAKLAPLASLPSNSTLSIHQPLHKSNTAQEIHAPRPPITSIPFKTHLTPSLEVIVKHLPLPTYFIPQQLRPPLRPLRSLERGHWAFPISSFPTDAWGKFWSFLESFIQEGRASWGVWCVVEGGRKGVEEQRSNNEEREVGELEKLKKIPEKQGKKPERKEKTNQDQKPKIQNQTPSPSIFPDTPPPIFKLYCWGETARELWLLLFIGSHRLIKGCGAQWIDARGEPVLQMK